MSYDLLRGLHILAVIAWMAGIMYLPRLFAYHADAVSGSEMDKTFQTMELKLYRIIMGPAMVVALILGLALIWSRGGGSWPGVGAFISQPFMIVKLAGVVFMIGWHHFLGAALKAYAEGRNRRSARFWKMTNELPFLAAIIMVIAVTTEFHF
jgi:protoporphyrinogen IX oxidase